MGLNWTTKKFSDFRSEKSLCNDFGYISSFEMESRDFYSCSYLFDFVSYDSIDINELEKFKYVEIGNVSKQGEIEPVELSFNDRSEEQESLFKKIEKGDILISKIHPYLNKNILITSDEIYFTKDFIYIRPKINAELLYLTIRQIFIKQLNAVSR